MSLINRIVDKLVNKKVNIDKTIFVKDFSKENKNLNKLMAISSKIISLDKKELIDRDIHFLKYGLDGEEKIAHELNNSYIPMLCLHDIRIEYNGKVAQLDFVLISNKFIYVLESKKLSGDIEINSNGEFTRIVKNNNGQLIKKEGMYSPISQNERHIKILSELLFKEIGINLSDMKSLIIMSNPKTILNKANAPKEIQDKICRYDQLVNILQNEYKDKKNNLNLTEKTVYEISNTILKYNKPIDIDYISKYSLETKDFKNDKLKKKKVVNTYPVNTYGENKLYEELKAYRLAVSKKENIKAYMVFSNEELDRLVKEKPKTIQQLTSIRGFGSNKAERYGDMIIKIIKMNS